MKNRIHEDLNCPTCNQAKARFAVTCSTCYKKFYDHYYEEYYHAHDISYDQYISKGHYKAIK